MAIIKVDCSNLNNSPHCPHGPTLEFTRVVNNKERTFFACSAYRDRKDCSFYHPSDEDITDRKKLTWELEKKRLLPHIDHKELVARFKLSQKLQSKQRAYCHTCNILCSLSENQSHKGHDFQTGISDYFLKHPSQIIKPQKDSKKEAQFFFTGKTTNLIIENLRQNGINKVLCIGTPRLHEKILEEENISAMKSLLLDLDHRYFQFYTEQQFCWFNMCNHHFLGNSADVTHEVFKNFLRDGTVAVVSDPPFGAHVEPLANMYKYIIQVHSKVTSSDYPVTVLWIFPYFMEPQIMNVFPSMVMLDYKVTYENHSDFKNGPEGNKNGSPVRIFTNMNVSKFKLPSNEGYRFCSICKRWVSLENKHCSKCNCCPSKNGQTYVHCDICGKCVKPNWTHCTVCKCCSLPSHTCNWQQLSKGSSGIQTKKRIQQRQQNKFCKKNKS